MFVYLFIVLTLLNNYRNDRNIRCPVDVFINPDLSNNASSISLYSGRSFKLPTAATDGFDVSILSATIKREKCKYIAKNAPQT